MAHDMKKEVKGRVSGASRENMNSLLRKSGFSLSNRVLELLWRYYNLIIEYNEKCDLTRIRRFDDFIIKHFVDSIMVERLIELPPSLLDIGTGAGFPGIPLKIVRPDLSLILAEQRSKRVEFLQTALRELQLEGAEIYPHGVTAHSFFHVEGVITRALEAVEKTLERVWHFLPAGGKVIFMKGPAGESEVILYEDVEDMRYILKEKKDYMLPGTTHRRCALVYEKKEDSVRKMYRILLHDGENREIVITSADNKRFKEWKKISSGDGVKESGLTLVSGARFVKERALIDTEGDMVIYDGYKEDDREMNEIISRRIAAGKVFLVKKALYNELDIYNTQRALLYTKIDEVPQWDGSPADGCTLLLPFQDPSNIGSIIRSAVAFGVNRIVLLRGAANPFHPRSVRASAGTVFNASLYRGPSMEEALSDAKCPCVALDTRGVPLETYRFPDAFFLLPGLEGPGIPGSLTCDKVSISIENNVESLNAAIAASIALYAWRCGNRQHSLS